MDTLTYTNNILDVLGIYWDDLAYNKQIKISYGDLIHSLIEYSSIKGVSEHLHISERTLERILPAALSNLCNTDYSNGTAWKFILLSKIDIRPCYSCKQFRSISRDYYFNDRKRCKFCDKKYKKENRLLHPEKYIDRAHNHYISNKHYYIGKSSKRKDIIKQATPCWANIDKINAIYNDCPEGYHVDHIVPLQGEFVCGLHVEHNMQYLTAKENLIKGNRFQ